MSLLNTWKIHKHLSWKLQISIPSFFCLHSNKKVQKFLKPDLGPLKKKRKDITKPKFITILLSFFSKKERYKKENGKRKKIFFHHIFVLYTHLCTYIYIYVKKEFASQNFPANKKPKTWNNNSWWSLRKQILFNGYQSTTFNLFYNSSWGPNNHMLLLKATEKFRSQLEGNQEYQQIKRDTFQRTIMGYER